MELYYTAEHEWIAVEGDVATVGITNHAQEALGDLVFVQLPAVGQALIKGGEAATVESVKAASDVLAPLTGEVTESNSALLADPMRVNADPMGAGWLFKLRFGKPAEIGSLLSESAYKATLP